MQNVVDVSNLQVIYYVLVIIIAGGSIITGVSSYVVRNMVRNLMDKRFSQLETKLETDFVTEKELGLLIEKADLSHDNLQMQIDSTKSNLKSIWVAINEIKNRRTV